MKFDPMDIEETSELYLRWIQFGVFSPILRTHSTKDVKNERRFFEYPGKFKWMLIDAVRLRYKLIPYIYSELYYNNKQGLSLISPCYYNHPTQEESYEYPHQYYFGNHLLLAPIFEKQTNNGAGQIIYLFEGKWYDLATGKYYPSGNKKITQQYLLNEIPAFAHPGTIIPTQFDVLRLSSPIYKNLSFIIYSGDNGHYDLYEDDGITNNYQNGEYAIIPISYQENSETDSTITLHAIQKNSTDLIRNIIIEIAFVRPPEKISIILNKEANNTDIPWQFRLDKTNQHWTYNSQETKAIISLPSLDLSNTITLSLHYSAPKYFSQGFKGIMNRILLIDQELKGANREEELQRQITRLGQTANRINRNPELFEEEIKQFYFNVEFLHEKLYQYPDLLNLERIDWIGWCKQLQNLFSLKEISLLPQRDLSEGKPYRLINLYHFYQETKAVLDADSNNPNGLIYLSSFLNSNSAWYLKRTTGNWFLIQNAFHLQQSLPSNLEAPSQIEDLIRRTENSGDLAQWMFIKEKNGYRIKNKYYEEQFLEQALIDAESSSTHQIYLTPYYSKNTLWYIVEA